MMKRVEELLTPWNGQTEIMLGNRHAFFKDYDRSAFREAMANAFLLSQLHHVAAGALPA